MSAAVASQIANAAVAAIEALDLTYNSTSFTVVRRKNPSLPRGKSPPQIVVSVSDRRNYRDLTATERLCSYALTIAVVTGGGAILSDDDALQLIHEQIRNAIAQKGCFNGAVSTFNQVDAGGDIPFDLGVLEKAALNYSIDPFTVQTIESRS